MKFKVGDFVINQNDINIVTKHIDHHHIELDNRWTVMKNECKLWKPKEGEWCWFYSDKMKLDNVGILRRFTQMEKDIEGNDMFGCEPTISDKEEFEYIKVFYKYCEPFIGELPTFLKEKNNEL